MQKALRIHYPLKLKLRQNRLFTLTNRYNTWYTDKIHVVTIICTIYGTLVQYMEFRYNMRSFKTWYIGTIYVFTIHVKQVQYTFLQYMVNRYNTRRYNTCRYKTCRYKTCRYKTCRYKTCRCVIHMYHTFILLLAVSYIRGEVVKVTNQRDITQSHTEGQLKLRF